MKPHWCGCKTRDAEACAQKFTSGPCPCACHKAERRHPRDVRSYLLQKLATRVEFVPTDMAENPTGPVAFTLKDAKSEIIVEYEPGEGFGLTLVGWCEDEDRTYRIDDVVAKVTYWLDGYI